MNATDKDKCPTCDGLKKAVSKQCHNCFTSYAARSAARKKGFEWREQMRLAKPVKDSRPLFIVRPASKIKLTAEQQREHATRMIYVIGRLAVLDEIAERRWEQIE